MPSPREPKPSDRPDARASRPRVRQVRRLLREKWPEYVVEILVIVFSISASFALDEWKDNQSKRDLERTYLQGLATDLAADSAHLTEVIAETALIVGTARDLLKPPPAGTSPVAPDNFLNSVRFIFKRPRFIAEDATFSDLKSSGNLQVISDFNLKNALFDYYRQYAAIEQVETAEREVTTNLIAPFVVRQLPLVPEKVAAGTIDPARIGALRSDVEFRNNVFIRQATREELLGDYRQIMELNAKLRDVLKQAK